MQYIIDLKQHFGQTIELRGWVSNKRSGKGLFFIVLRDGSGFCQCVVDEKKVSAESFESAKHATMESAIALNGIVIKDEKQIGGFEIQVESCELISIAEEFPIAKKEHGVDFLMDNRHLWIRSRRQWAILRIRNRIIMAIQEFF